MYHLTSNAAVCFTGYVRRPQLETRFWSFLRRETLSALETLLTSAGRTGGITIL